MVMGLYRVKDPYCISATAATCAVTGCNLLKSFEVIYILDRSNLSVCKHMI